MKYKVINKINKIVTTINAKSLSEAKGKAIDLYGFKCNLSSTRFISENKGELCVICES